MLSISDKVVKLIKTRPAGWAFTATDLLHIAPRATIDWVLYQLVKDQEIKRAMRGVYYRPRIGKVLKEDLGPDVPSVAQALARRFNWAIQPSGVTALNYLGLSTQLSGSYLYQSSGPDKSYKVGNYKLEFRQAALKETDFAHQESMLLVVALRALGEDRIDAEVIAILRSWLAPAKRAAVLKDTQKVTGWIFDAIRRITAEDD